MACWRVGSFRKTFRCGGDVQLRGSGSAAASAGGKEEAWLLRVVTENPEYIAGSFENQALRVKPF